MTTHAPRTSHAAPPADRAAAAGSRPRRPRDLDRWLLALAVASIAVPFLVLVVPPLLHDGPFSNFGDVATMELAVQRASEIDQTVGPYSRYRWFHPGPLVFYLLAVPYRLMGGQGEALVVGTVAINATASIWLVGLVGRRCGARAALAAAAATGVLHLVLSMEVLADAWTPFLITVPTALFIVLCADSLADGRWSLAGSVAVGSFLVQTHIGMTAAVVAGLGLTVAVWLWSRWRRLGRRLLSRAELTPLAAAVALGVVLWSPPLWQELRARPGNMTALFRFFLEGESGGHGLGEAAAALASGVLGTRPHLRGAVTGAGIEVLWLGLVLVAIATVTVVAWRHQRRFAVALGAISLTVALAGFVSLLRVEGPLHGYLVVWTGAIPLGGALAAVAAAAPSGERRRHPVARPTGRPGAVTIALVAATVGVAALSTGDALGADPEAGSSTVRAATDAVSPLLAPADDDVLVCIIAQQPGPWGIAVGVVTDLRRSGIDARVQDHWLFAFGDQLAPDGDERVMLELDTTLGPPRPVPLGSPAATAATADLRARAFRSPDGAPVSQSVCPPPT